MKGVWYFTLCWITWYFVLVPSELGEWLGKVNEGYIDVLY